MAFVPPRDLGWSDSNSPVSQTQEVQSSPSNSWDFPVSCLFSPGLQFWRVWYLFHVWVNPLNRMEKNNRLNLHEVFKSRVHLTEDCFRKERGKASKELKQYTLPLVSCSTVTTFLWHLGAGGIGAHKIQSSASRLARLFFEQKYFLFKEEFCYHLLW